MDIDMEKVQNGLLRKIQEKLIALGCEVKVGNFGDNSVFDCGGNNIINGDVVINTNNKIRVDGLEYLYGNLSLDVIIDKIEKVTKPFQQGKSKIMLGGYFDNYDMIIEFGYRTLTIPFETPKVVDFDKMELSFADKIIEDLKLDAKSLSKLLRNDPNYSEYKMLINNLKTTMELIQELEGKESPTTINIGTITLDNVTNADDFLNQLKTRYNNILNKK